MGVDFVGVDLMGMNLTVAHHFLTFCYVESYDFCNLIASSVCSMNTAMVTLNNVATQQGLLYMHHLAGKDLKTL